MINTFQAVTSSTRPVGIKGSRAISSRAIKTGIWSKRPGIMDSARQLQRHHLSVAVYICYLTYQADKRKAPHLRANWISHRQNRKTRVKTAKPLTCLSKTLIHNCIDTQQGNNPSSFERVYPINPIISWQGVHTAKGSKHLMNGSGL